MKILKTVKTLFLLTIFSSILISPGVNAQVTALAGKTVLTRSFSNVTELAFSNVAKGSIAHTEIAASINTLFPQALTSLLSGANQDLLFLADPRVTFLSQGSIETFTDIFEFGSSFPLIQDVTVRNLLVKQKAAILKALMEGAKDDGIDTDLLFLGVLNGYFSLPESFSRMVAFNGMGQGYNLLAANHNIMEIIFELLDAKNSVLAFHIDRIKMANSSRGKSSSLSSISNFIRNRTNIMASRLERALVQSYLHMKANHGENLAHLEEIFTQDLLKVMEAFEILGIRSPAAVGKMKEAITTRGAFAWSEASVPRLFSDGEVLVITSDKSGFERVTVFNAEDASTESAASPTVTETEVKAPIEKILVSRPELTSQFFNIFRNLYLLFSLHDQFGHVSLNNLHDSH